MIKVEKPSRATDPQWSGLVADALRARQGLIDAFDKKGDVEVDDRLYKRYMSFLGALFHGKCAYCETDIAANQPGDVEHFRPKGRVVDDQFKPIRIMHAKWGEIDHPGYFWLAYDWENLFPACADCNRYRKHGHEKDSGAGKADRFPVDGFRAAAPGEESQEHPLLVNPSECDPNEHFEFLATGEIKARTPRGEATLKCLGLNRREGLVKARKVAYMSAAALLRAYLMALLNENATLAAENRDQVNEIWAGRQPYTAMQRFGIDAVRAVYTTRGIDVPMPLE